MEVTELNGVEDTMHRLKDVGRYLHAMGSRRQRSGYVPIEGTASNALLRLVDEQSVDLIVCGAYGHTRLGEWIFGGPRPCLRRVPYAVYFRTSIASTANAGTLRLRDFGSAQEIAFRYHRPPAGR